MDMQTVISAVVPVYKTPEKFLRACIESLLAQSLKSAQIILVDDGSPDNCGEICDEYAARDRRIEVIHQRNSGPSAARNQGLKQVKGKYLTFVDADDMLSPNAWEHTVCVMEEREADCAVFGWIKNETGSPIPYSVCTETLVLDAEDAMARIAGHNEECGGGFPWNKVWNAEKLKAAFGGSLPLFDRELFAYEDKYWILQCLHRLSRVVLLPEVYYDYRFVASSLTNNVSSWKKRQFNAYLAYDKICDFLQPLSQKAYRESLKMYFGFCFIDLKNMYAGRKGDIERYKQTQASLLRVCRRIRWGDLKGVKYILAWSFCSVMLPLNIRWGNKRRMAKLFGRIQNKWHRDILLHLEDMHRQMYDHDARERELMVRMRPRKLLRLVIDIVDGCNLNCRSCPVCAPCMEGTAEAMADRESFVRDIQRIAEIFSEDEIAYIALAGGEPMLHPQLLPMMQILRENFPSTQLWIYTNGTRLIRENKSFWESCRELSYGIYQTVQNRKLNPDAVKRTAANYAVTYQTADGQRGAVWHVPLSLPGLREADERENFLCCPNANQETHLKNGKMYTCAQIPNAEALNQRFHTNFRVTAQDFVDIYQENSSRTILGQLAEPTAFCRYCRVHDTQLHSVQPASQCTVDEWVYTK